MPEHAKVPGWAVKLPELIEPSVYGHFDEKAGKWRPGVYDLMLAHPDKMGRIGSRLLKGRTGDAEAEAVRVYEEAEREALHAMRVDALRIDLYNAIHEARQAGLKAEAAIARLEADDVYDVEIAESADVGYLKSFIADIRKAGAAAHRFLPFDENGDLK